MRNVIILFLLCFSGYALTNYGGVRAPDSEVVFRLSESLTDSLELSVKDLEAWPGFGVSAGVDGKYYSVYPPLESFILVPVLWAGQRINQNQWYDHMPPPVSHYAGRDLEAYILNKPPDHPEKHALRYLASLADVIICSLAVLVFYGIISLIAQSGTTAMLTSLVFAFGTIAWSYAGSLFSEPMSTLLVLLSLYGLFKTDPGIRPPDGRLALTGFLSGMALGLAAAAHYTAFLFAPFFLIYVLRNTFIKLPHERSRNAMTVGFWILGFGLLLFCLGYYNYIRFGDCMQSGRSLSSYNQVDFVPLLGSLFRHNLYGLLAGSGKGLILFCPVVLLCILVWRPFQRKHTFLSYLLIWIIVTRIAFIALYKDWHGGFSLGPRYLYMIIPLFLIPAGYWFSGILKNRKKTALMVSLVFIIGCVIQQLYLALGEIFSYFHIINLYNRTKNVNVFADDRIYMDWNLTPLIHLHQYKRGPWLLQSVNISNFALWVWCSIILLGIIITAAVLIVKRADLNGSCNKRMKWSK